MPVFVRRRPAFTLIELMVSMALTLFVMMILTQAFTTSLETFSQLKSIGEMQANLRTVSSLLLTDLASDHFEGDRRLSSPDLLTVPPRQGFFYIYQGSAPVVSLSSYGGKPLAPLGYLNEGSETGYPQPPGPLGLASCRANDQMLYFTVRQRGNRPENYFSAYVPGSPLASTIQPPNFFGQSVDAMGQPPGFFNSQWAEVCYFLVQTGSTVEPANPQSLLGTPLFALYRAQYLLVPNPASVNAPPTAWPPAAVPYPLANVSGNYQAAANALLFLSPDDVAGNPAAGIAPVRTLNAGAVPPIRPSDPALGAAGTVGGNLEPGTPPSGATLVLSNVTSFQVQVYTLPPRQDPITGLPILDFVDLPAPPAPGPNQILPNVPAQSNPTTYDTSSLTNSFNIVAIKVTVRVWDTTSQMSRQITVIQDM